MCLSWSGKPSDKQAGRALLWKAFGCVGCGWARACGPRHWYGKHRCAPQAGFIVDHGPWPRCTRFWGACSRGREGTRYCRRRLCGAGTPDTGACAAHARHRPWRLVGKPGQRPAFRPWCAWSAKDGLQGEMASSAGTACAESSFFDSNSTFAMRAGGRPARARSLQPGEGATGGVVVGGGGHCRKMRRVQASHWTGSSLDTMSAMAWLSPIW